MKLTTLELAAALALAAVVSYSAGSVAARDADTVAGVSGDWQASFTVDRAFPRQTGDPVRTADARVHLDLARPLPARSAAALRPDALDGDLRVFGMRGEALRGAEIHPARGDSVEITLGSGARAVVLTGKPECGRITGHWRHESRAEAETGRFELRRGTETES
jgi:hypothetical protein